MSKRRDPAAFLEKLWALEDQLIAAGFPAMPEKWRETIERFIRGGKRRLVVRKGRRVFASTCVAPRLAVAEMLFGQHPHLPGTPPHVFAFLSVKRGEAANRLRGVKAILDVLGEPYTERDQTIELASRPAVFAVMTASFRTSVGETVAFCWCDEVARWNDADTSANPAEQVIASVSPALATLPDAKLYLVSTPLANEDYHAKAYELGDTEAQCVAFGASWDFNPTLTREVAAELEPDPKLRAREYGGIPAASVSGAFEPDHVLRCFRAVPTGAQFHQAMGVLDSAAGKRAGADQFTWGVVAYAIPPAPEPYLRGMVPRMASVSNVAPDQLPESVRHYWRPGEFRYPDPRDMIPGILTDEHGQPMPNPAAQRPRVPLLVMKAVDSMQGAFQRQLVDGTAWRRIREMFRMHGVSHCVGDNYAEVDAHKELGWGRYTGVSWDNPDKVDAVYRLRQLMADDALILPIHDKLKSELLAYTERIKPSGTVDYSARGSGKDDHVSLLINAVIGERLRKLPGSDRFAPAIRHEVSGR
jgi:hypothetical protein